MERLRTYSQYSLWNDERLIVRRHQNDRHLTVCFIDTVDQWNIFCAALRAGKNEVQAVHAIDE